MDRHVDLSFVREELEVRSSIARHRVTIAFSPCRRSSWRISDVLASDFTKPTSGFIGAFQFINSDEVFVPNPDVKATRLRVED